MSGRGRVVARVVVAALAALLQGCGGCGGGASGADGDGGPPGAVGTAIPDAMAGAFPLTDGGVPILFELSATLPAGLSVGLVYDPTLDDPVTRWGQCLSLVLGCYRADPTSITGCVAKIPACASDEGGRACCPRECLFRYSEYVRVGTAENDAVDLALASRDCVPGLPAVTP